MVAEGRRLADIAPNVVVKIPLIKDGIKAIRTFTDEGIKNQLYPVFLTHTGPGRRKSRRNLYFSFCWSTR